ncbi:hypothetical protein BO94DRAFT_601035, partial [Aspergillus sclerotioniger CBS 115572]
LKQIIKNPSPNTALFKRSPATSRPSGESLPISSLAFRSKSTVLTTLISTLHPKTTNNSLCETTPSCTLTGIFSVCARFLTIHTTACPTPRVVVVLNFPSPSSYNGVTRPDKSNNSSVFNPKSSHGLVKSNVYVSPERCATSRRWSWMVILSMKMGRVEVAGWVVSQPNSDGI